MVDINDIDLDDEEIAQLNQSDLDRLKDTMSALLGPSQNELFQWQVWLQHLPFLRMKSLAGKGVIPAKFRKTNFPFCSWHIFGKQYRKPWWSFQKKVQIRHDDEPDTGMFTSTDKSVLAQGG